jgi:hypothetical protein
MVCNSKAPLLPLSHPLRLLVLPYHPSSPPSSPVPIPVPFPFPILRLPHPSPVLRPPSSHSPSPSLSSIPPLSLHSPPPFSPYTFQNSVSVVAFAYRVLYLWVLFSSVRSRLLHFRMIEAALKEQMNVTSCLLAEAGLDLVSRMTFTDCSPIKNELEVKIWILGIFEISRKFYFFQIFCLSFVEHFPKILLFKFYFA